MFHLTSVQVLSDVAFVVLRLVLVLTPNGSFFLGGEGVAPTAFSERYERYVVRRVRTSVLPSHTHTHITEYLPHHDDFHLKVSINV
jgi:hypothetical protein